MAALTYVGIDITSKKSGYSAALADVFWADGYFASTVDKHGDEQITERYGKNQGDAYHKLHADHQLTLF